MTWYHYYYYYYSYHAIEKHNPPETTVSAPAMAARRAPTRSPIRVPSLSRRRQQSPLRRLGSQPPLPRPSFFVLQGPHRRTPRRSILNLVPAGLHNRTSRRSRRAIVRVTNSLSSNGLFPLLFWLWLRLDQLSVFLTDTIVWFWRKPEEEECARRLRLLTSKYDYSDYLRKNLSALDPEVMIIRLWIHNSHWGLYWNWWSLVYVISLLTEYFAIRCDSKWLMQFTDS